MSLIERKKRFSSFTNAFNCEQTSELIAAHKIDSELFDRLQFSACLYLSKSLADISFVASKTLTNPEALLAMVEKNLGNIRNFTPNGMVVPKRDHLLEYNFFASAFMDIISSLNIGPLIDCWVNPPNIRFKEGQFDLKKLERNFASEHIHSESWIPLNGSDCISIFIPLAGDIANNFVEFYVPPKENFNEEWLNPQPSYASASHISENYKPAEVKYEVGKLYLADCATLHATKRKSTCGPRLSIDLNFIPRINGKQPLNSELSHENLLKLGKEKIFAFHDSMNEFSDTANGKSHPSQHRSLIEPFA